MQKQIYTFLFIITFFLFQCGDSVKPDQVIDSSPGPKPAWTTGEKKKDTPQTEYYVGYAKSKSKSQCREKAIRDVTLQISKRIMVDVYSADISKDSVIVSQTATITSNTIIYDLKVNQEYYQQKKSSQTDTWR